MWDTGLLLCPACRWTRLPRRGLSPSVTTLGHTHIADFTCCRWRGVCRNAFALQLPPGSTVPFTKSQVDSSVCILMFLQPHFHLCMRCCLKDGKKSLSSHVLDICRQRKPSLQRSAEGTGLTALRVGEVRGSTSSLHSPCPHCLFPAWKKACLFLTWRSIPLKEVSHLFFHPVCAGEWNPIPSLHSVTRKAGVFLRSLLPPRALLCPQLPAEDGCVVAAEEQASSRLFFLSRRAAGAAPACRHVITCTYFCTRIFLLFCPQRRRCLLHTCIQPSCQEQSNLPGV